MHLPVFSAVPEPGVPDTPTSDSMGGGHPYAGDESRDWTEEEILNRLAAAAEYRDDVTGRHVQGVSRLENWETAESWYLGSWHLPLAHQRLGRVYETMSKPEEAATAYRRFIAAWEDADEPLQGRGDEARKRPKQLSSSGSDS